MPSDAKAFLEEVFGSVFGPHGEGAVSRYFTEDYVQSVDGKTLDRAQFEQHLSVLRSQTKEIQFTFRTVVAEGDHIADVHRAHVVMKDGSRVVSDVYCFAQLRDGKIAYIEEATRHVEGDDANRDLGSRT